MADDPDAFTSPPFVRLGQQATRRRFQSQNREIAPFHEFELNIHLGIPALPFDHQVERRTDVLSHSESKDSRQRSAVGAQPMEQFVRHAVASVRGGIDSPKEDEFPGTRNGQTPCKKGLGDAEDSGRGAHAERQR